MFEKIRSRKVIAPDARAGALVNCTTGWYDNSIFSEGLLL
jgi:hypothetical protein